MINAKTSDFFTKILIKKGVTIMSTRPVNGITAGDPLLSPPAPQQTPSGRRVDPVGSPEGFASPTSVDVVINPSGIEERPEAVPAETVKAERNFHTRVLNLRDRKASTPQAGPVTVSPLTKTPESARVNIEAVKKSIAEFDKLIPSQASLLDQLRQAKKLQKHIDLLSAELETKSALVTEKEKVAVQLASKVEETSSGAKSLAAELNSLRAAKELLECDLGTVLDQAEQLQNQLREEKGKKATALAVAAATKTRLADVAARKLELQKLVISLTSQLAQATEVFSTAEEIRKLDFDYTSKTDESPAPADKIAKKTEEDHSEPPPQSDAVTAPKVEEKTSGMLAAFADSDDESR